MNRRILSTVAVIVAASCAFRCSAQGSQKKQGAGVIFSAQSGSRWLSWDRNERVAYVVGFVEGWREALFELAVGHADCSVPAAEKQGAFTAAPIDQLVDSVDKFYSDPLNRQVRVPDAIIYVRDQIAGMSPEALEKRLQEIRRKGQLNTGANQDESEDR